MKQLIPKEFDQKLQLTEITAIKLNKKQGQTIMKKIQEFTDKYYQQHNLDYLRKIKPEQKPSENIFYFLCLQQHYSENFLIEQNLHEKLEEFQPYQIIQNIQVPSYEALNKEQMEIWNKYWPTKFSDKEKQYRTNLK